MRRNGFTLVELLVVIAIIALLMGILMPALSRVRQLAFRLVCGTNLSAIGKAMMIYANDYDDGLPRAGSRDSKWWQESVKWDAANKYDAYGLNPDGTGGKVTITSSFYLLVKYTDVTPKSFLCKNDSDVTEFVPGNGHDLVDLWDFGPKGAEHCSYSYQLPYCEFPLSVSSDPGMPIAGDPNPWVANKEEWDNFDPDGGKESILFGNSITHQSEGQNVLFMDTHVEFEKTPFCGLNEDNIYTLQNKGIDIRKGKMPTPKFHKPLNRTDSLLVNDGLAPN